MPVNTFSGWSAQKSVDHGPHKVVVVVHTTTTRKRALERLKAEIPKHYIDPKVSAQMLRRLGAENTADLFEELLPVSPRARAGDLGEILATEYALTRLGYRVPIFRLRWKDGREMALRGDDLVAYLVDEDGLVVLKGEVKARRHLSESVLEQVRKKLKNDRGRPNRHTVMFLVMRLHELEEHETAGLLEDTLITTARKVRFRHFAFTVSKNRPRPILEPVALDYPAKYEAQFVGMQVADYDDFISQVFEELNA